ncbi:MAG: MAPEG family protein [Deltaproteobacteria bacterium]|nr:MAPEG family protein [Deltaproteobacteria bacterium]
MTPTTTALLGFAGWYLLLTFALGVFRSSLVLSGKKAANTFAADGSDVGAFGQRLSRARDNCYETLPLFAAIALAASIAGKLEVLDPLAPYVLCARIGQSVTHLVSTSLMAINVRFVFFIVQVVIYAIWILRLLG